MDVGEPDPGTSAVDKLSEATSEDYGMSLQIVVDEPMPEASHTSKRVRELEESELPDKKSSEKKIYIYTADEEYKSCIAHIKEIVEGLESSNFTNIQEILRMSPNLEVEHAVGTMVALAGSTKPEGDMPSNGREFYRERERIKDKNVSRRSLHQELKEEGFYP